MDSLLDSLPDLSDQLEPERAADLQRKAEDMRAQYDSLHRLIGEGHYLTSRCGRHTYCLIELNERHQTANTHLDYRRFWSYLQPSDVSIHDVISVFHQWMVQHDSYIFVNDVLKNNLLMTLL